MSPLEFALKNVIKDAIFEALDEYTTKIGGVVPAVLAGVTEPGTTRKKKAKEEVTVKEAVKDEPLQVVSEPVAVDSAAKYKAIQELVVVLLNNEKRDHVVGVLQHYNISTFLKLPAEKYDEAYVKLKEGCAQQEALT